MDIDLSGRRALVSGSSQGIGLAIATELARAGASVTVNGRDDAKTEAACTTVTDEVPDARVSPVAADLASAAGAERLREAVGELDILVNNLGIFGAKPVLDIEDDEWRRYFEVNVLSAVRLIRMYLPGMMARGFGRVMNIASDSAVVTPVEMVHYGTTKTALLAVTRGFAKAAAGTGVTVNSVMAGPTHTPGVEDFVRDLVGADLPWDEAQRRFMREHRPYSLIQRLIEPTEIGNMVVYLSSERASATTGGAVRVDGGYIDSILP
ncbi:NAD(P)-dependent dehydrogenase (short-subunit alcohol dehydrogenase family) [Nocardia tenerifensis]|uniref:3-oxoacyl-[acyl-carrier-protein] reductase MabA n=1 Tax=Nocardia tenerifensis TaxID=228006 RepID=A0A318JTT4_9NOCA|nr:SDR family oxidoreductase [Nocardia tenerifensis]PXX54807.1 NAD(P)-dependent dehydrogenase (short-subunit alcohol dehydrogenase family) [Nocardia tenerifensis]